MIFYFSILMKTITFPSIPNKFHVLYYSPIFVHASNGAAIIYFYVLTTTKNAKKKAKNTTQKRIIIVILPSPQP